MLAKFDRELIEKYDRPGPRYTSYPTAPHFSPEFGAAAVAEILRETNAASAPPDLSLYVHLPFCEKLCYFCGCNMLVRSDHERSFPYLDNLEKELDTVAKFVKPGRKVRQAHFGGGTPTFLPPEALDRLCAALRSRFDFAPDAELGIEVHPNETRPEHFDALQKHGWTRLSLGIQDFDPRVQLAVNRIQPYELTRDCIVAARARGFTSVNVDLMYGLPHQSVTGFAKTIDQVLTLAPDRIALFNFAYLPEMIKHQSLIDAAALPTPQVKMDLFELAANRFLDAGFVFIGMDHFARPEDRLAKAQAAGSLHRNFQGYSTLAGLDLYAFGVSAISEIGPSYSQNFKELPLYEQSAGAGNIPAMRGIRLTDEDLLRREVIMNLMCNFRLDKAVIAKQFSIDFNDHFSDALTELAPMAADGLIELHPDRLQVTPRGRFLIRNLVMPFDARLPASSVRYSRTV